AIICSADYRYQKRVEKGPLWPFFHGLKNVRVMSGSYPPGFQPDHPLYAIKLIFPSDQLLFLPTKIIPTHQQAFKTEGGGRLGVFCGIPPA
ncbi:TPA: hypothetical protein ACSP2E_002132, partial [Aeromonas hydrophila]